MKTVLQDMDIDIWEVVKAASTKPFGFMPFYPGPGLGGHCIPIDPYYLTWKAKEVGRNTRFIELAGEVNSSMPHYVVGATGLALNQVNKASARVKILVVDWRTSRTSMTCSLHHLSSSRCWTAWGAQVSYHDPWVPETWRRRKHDLGMSVPLSVDSLGALRRRSDRGGQPHQHRLRRPSPRTGGWWSTPATPWPPCRPDGKTAVEGLTADS